MRKSYLLSNALMLLAMLLAACAPKATPTAVATEPPATLPPTEVPATATEAPADAGATPTLEAINLAGPEMALHSTYLYVDRTLLVAVPGGPFVYGKKGGTDNPEITVTLGDYWIYQTEVTNQQYASCVKVGKCSSPNVEDNPSYLDRDRQNDPVTGVDWNQSRAYCQWVHADLPTEPQWEKAARGPNASIYPWGDGAPSCALLNFNNCVGKTTMVLSYDPQGKSYFDALDMAGNSYEWTLDIYDPFYYRNAPLEDPPGPDTGERRSIRSGGYKSNKDQIPSFARFFDFPNAHRRDLGFRCVVKDPTFYAPFCEQIPNVALGGGSGLPNAGTDYVCPIVSVSSEEQHCGSGSTYVKFDTDIPAQTSIGGVGGCALIVGGGAVYPQIYDCHAPGAATIDGTCHYPGAEATCATNYILDGGVCKWDTSIPVGTACPDGYVYDEINHCCTAGPGDVVNYPLCQAPFTLHVDADTGNNICSNDPHPSHDDDSWVLPAACGDNNNPYTGLPIVQSPFYVALKEEKAELPVTSVSGILTLVALGLVGWVTRRGRKRS